MKFPPLRALAIAIACFFVTAVGNSAQQDFSKVEIKATKVAGNIYMLEGAGGNIGVCAGDDGIVIVDDQFAPLASKIREALKGINDKPLKFIINTHFHGDHTGGNAALGKEGTIIAHENVRKRLQEGGPVGGNNVPPAKEGLPIITFNDRTTVHVNGEDVRAIHFPHGHTDGDSVIFFTKANVVHMGDDFVTYGFPFVDTRNGGSVSGMIARVEKVLAMVPPDVKIIPGHGPLSTTEDMRKFVQLLKETRGLVADAVKEAEQDIRTGHIKFYWAGSIASRPVGVPIELAKEYPQANAGNGCITNDIPLRERQQNTRGDTTRRFTPTSCRSIRPCLIHALSC
jgi:glyoxylase-like metal-dependent hydrolase (beta-lactamase superfamily II)